MHNNTVNTIRGRDGWANMQKRAANVVFNSFSKFIFVACNIKYNAWGTFLFGTKL